ncbi:DUF2783 domain-containing protein [Undibacterium sp. CY18W]|uniref:DUF2783 domain-containing protein n=1 Tax=Undibacterium hunanense TaxID=2762292 RepID=A0ABR6ZRP5_9BURK|nr:DUF2783 domain-containing protein [Undibacterium hunanense]MBC3918544.1 DUF2783 domain-containing protein [Undibacterium hunanense]
MPLQLQPNFHYADISKQQGLREHVAGDDFYQMLIDAHRDLSDEDSSKLNAKLILLLANHIGELDTLAQALSLAAGKKA